MNCFVCSKTLKNPKICPYCDIKICSESCLSLHCILNHREIYKSNIENNEKEINNNNSQQSPYIVKGYFCKKIKYDPIYSLKNFVPAYFNEKKKLIGYGSFGKVFLVINTYDKKYYAIKHMEKKSIYKALHSLDTIYNEIKIQSLIRHPNIVNILYVNETETSFDLVLEYAPKGNLFFYIQKNGYLSEFKSFLFFIQIVNAIYFLHKNNYIHRDIKPENILLFDNNIAKLCDFGWCVKMVDKPRTTYCGTTEYMSPEMINDGIYGKEIDNWSLGILLYEMLHGYSPFKPHKPVFNDKDVIENIRFQRSIMFNNKLSDECIDLINHLLEKNIKRRYNTEDIFNCKFVKNFEKLKYFLPPKDISEEDENKNNSKEIEIVANKTAKIFYPKKQDSLNQIKLFQTHTYECEYDSNINENDIQTNDNYINQNNIDRINSNINLKTNFNLENYSESNILNKEEFKQNNFLYISSNKSNNVEIDEKNSRNNIIRIKDKKKYHYNKSFSQQKDNKVKCILDYNQKKNIIIKEKNEDEYENRIKRKATNDSYNFNNINIILCNNNLNNNIYSNKINNSALLKGNKINNFNLNINNNTIDAIRNNKNKKQNINNKNINNIIRVRNSSRDLLYNSIQLDGDSNNLIVKKIRIFQPKISNIGEINNKSKDIIPICIKYNEPNICINNNEIKNKNIINYFKSFSIKSIEKIKRNSFPQRLENKNGLNNYKKYHTIQNKKELFIKNKTKNNIRIILNKSNINDNIFNNNIKADNNENKCINNNSFEENINKDISNNNLYKQDNIKTPKKKEDNFILNPKTLINRLKKELYNFNNTYEDENPENFI